MKFPVCNVIVSRVLKTTPKNVRKDGMVMDIQKDKLYLRIENVVYVELKEGESPEEAEDRFLCCLPEGMDIASYRAECWYPDQEE